MKNIVYKGIVVDVLEDGKVIVLLRNGMIKKVTPHRPYEIGEEILFQERVITKKVINWNRVFSCVSSVAVALFLFFMHIPLISDDSIGIEDAYASVYIESKSDVKVDVDKNQDVIRVMPLNRPAQRVLDELDWNGEQIDEFISDYFEEMKNEGYLGAEDKAIISVVPIIESQNNETLKIIKETVNKNEFIKVNHIKVFTVALPKKVVEKAECLGLTPAKFSIMLIAKSVGKNIPPLDMLKTVTVTELIDLNPTVANILPNYSEEKLVKLAEQHDNTNTALTPEEGENSQITTTTATRNDQPAPNETTEQSNQPVSNKVTETDNTSTQNETYVYSGDSQNSSGTESASDSTESYNSTESTEQTQTTSDDNVSKDDSTSSINTESEQASSQADNDQQSQESQDQTDTDQQSTDSTTTQDTESKQDNTGEEKKSKDEQNNDKQDMNKQEDKQDENKQDQENQNKDEQDKDKQNEDKQDGEKQNKDQQNEDQQDGDKQNNDKQDENKQNNDEQDKDKSIIEMPDLEQLVTCLGDLVTS